MRSNPLRPLAGLLLLLASAPAPALAAGERPAVEVDCRPTGEKLVFHCTFEVTGRKSRQPVEGAAFKVGADMPTMPMAHNIKPIRPEPVAGEPGVYEGRLALEMPGEWALKMTFDEPVRDIVIEKMTFGGAAAAADHSGHGTGHGGPKADHSGRRDPKN